METEKKKFGFKMPHAYVLIVCLILIAGILSYILPAGMYEKVVVEGRKVVDPNSYHTVPNTPVNLWKMFLAIPQGLIKQAGIIFMIIVIAGSVEIINKTGALEASIGRLAHAFRNRPFIVIPLLLLCFVILGALNVSNAIVAFIPLGLLIAFNLGADALVGVSLVGMGMNLGFTGGAFVAPTTGIAQAIIGLPMFSGWEFRLIVTTALWAAGSIFLSLYVKRLQRDPTTSVVYGVEGVVTQAGDVQIFELTARRRMVLLAFLIGFGFVVYGAIESWSANDAIPAVFLATGLACGFIYGFSPSEIAKIFVKGCEKITFGALIVGISAGIGVVLTNGNIIDTVVHGLAGVMTGLPKVLAAQVMYVVNIIINTFITSGSGQAATVIPILSPVGDVLGLTQQSVVLAFQFGDGFTNQILPMSSVLMAGLAFGGIPYGKWLQYIWKWLLLNLVIGAVFLAIATMMNIGPF
jgi:uncharacterized ion transporter superfamily protein YfcC